MQVKRVVRKNLAETRCEIDYKTHRNPYISFFRNQTIRLTGPHRGYLAIAKIIHMDNAYPGADYHLRFVVLATNNEYAKNPVYRDEVWYVTFNALD